MLPDHGTPKSSRTTDDVEKILQEVPASSNRPPSPIPIFSDENPDEKWPYGEALRKWNKTEIALYDEIYADMKLRGDEEHRESWTRYYIQRSIYEKMAKKRDSSQIVKAPLVPTPPKVLAPKAPPNPIRLTPNPASMNPPCRLVPNPDVIIVTTPVRQLQNPCTTPRAVPKPKMPPEPTNESALPAAAPLNDAYKRSGVQGAVDLL